MSGSRADPSGNSIQLWPPMNQDPITADVVWDDSELVAHYDRVDAFVKKKLNALYTAQRNGSSQERTVQNPSVRRPRSARESSPALKAKVKEKEKRKPPRFNCSLHRERLTERARVNSASYSLEAALHSERPEPALNCDFQWLPPTLYPPDELFRPPTTSPRSTQHSTYPRSKSLNRAVELSQINQTTALKPPLPGALGNFEHLLQSWYEAGYNLGREHALKHINSSDTSV